MTAPSPREVDDLLTVLVRERDEARHNGQTERARVCQQLAEAAARRVGGVVVLDGEVVSP